MDDIEWTIVNEGQLLDAMFGHKPVGVNKHFQMALICEKLGNDINKDVDPEKIWEHLGTMYNLEALEEQESIPFPNSIREFALPEDQFGVLMLAKGEYIEFDNMPKLFPSPNLKETPHSPYRNSNSNTKELKRDTERTKSVTRNRNSNGTYSKTEETPKTSKRPLRGSMKLEEVHLNAKSSPIPSSKRRRLI